MRVVRPRSRFARKIAPTGGDQSRVIQRGVRFVVFVSHRRVTFAYSYLILVRRLTFALVSPRVSRVVCDRASLPRDFRIDGFDFFARMYLLRVTKNKKKNVVDGRLVRLPASGTDIVPGPGPGEERQL